MDFVSTIKYMDLFGTTCKFYINQKPKYWTLYGGVLSIISILLFILLFFYLNFDDFKYQNPQTTTSSIPLSDYRKIKFGEEKIWIPWRLTDYNHRFLKHKDLLYPIIKHRLSIKNKNETISSSIKIISYRLCNETSMANLNKNKFIFNFPLDKLYCIDMDDLEIGGNWEKDYLSFIQFDLYLCKNGIDFDENNTNCTTFEKISNIVGPNNSLSFEFFYPIVKFQPTNLKNPVVVVYKESFFHLSKWTFKKKGIYLQEHVIKDDTGLLYAKPKNSSYWGVSIISGDDYSNSIKSDIVNIEGNSRIYSLDIYTDTEITYSTRQFKKVFTLIIETLPILTVIYSIFKKFTKVFKQSSTYKKVTESLFEKLKIKTDKFLIHLKNNVNDMHRLSVSNLQFNKIKSSQNNENNHKINNSNVNILNFNQSNDLSVFKNIEINNNIGARTPKKYYRSETLFPFRYYILTVLLKNITNKRIFSRQYIEVNNFISYIFDVTTYVILKKEFDSLIKTLIERKILENYKSSGRINISKRSFLRDMNDYLNRKKN